MGASVGSIFIDLALNSAAFASDLGKAGSAINSFSSKSNLMLAKVVNGFGSVSKSANRFISDAISMRSVMLTLAGAGGLGLLIKNSLEAAEAIGTAADTIGISTDTLQEYRYAATLANVSTGQMESGFKKFTKSVGDAHNGTGALYNFLKKSNPVLLEQVTSAKSVDQALNATFSTMAKYGSATDRAALAGAAFGKANLEMALIVKDGAGAIELLRQRAHDLGIVVSEDLIRKADEAKDKWEVLAMVIKSKMVVAVAENSDQIGVLADNLIKIIPALIELASNIAVVVDVFFNWRESLLSLEATWWGFVYGLEKGVSSMAGTVNAWVDAWRGAFGHVGALYSAFVKDMAETIRHPLDNGGFDNLKAEMAKGFSGAFKESYAATIKETEGFNREIDAKLNDKLMGIRDKINAIKEGSKTAVGVAASTGSSEFAKQMRDAAVAEEAATKAAEKAQKDAEAAKKRAEREMKTKAKSIFDSTRNPDETYANTMSELNEMVKAGALDWDTYNRAAKKAKETLTDAQREGSLFGEVMDKALSGNIKSWKDLGGVILSVLQNALKNAAMGKDTNILGGLGSIGSSIGSIWTSISSWFHGGGVVGSGGSQRRVNPGVFANAPRFHSGGLVGGEVPIIAKKGERVLTEAQQRQGLGNSVTYNIDARGAEAGVEERLKAMIMEVSNSVEGRSVSAVQKARFRNPQLFGGA